MLHLYFLLIAASVVNAAGPNKLALAYRSQDFPDYTFDWFCRPTCEKSQVSDCSPSITAEFVCSNPLHKNHWCCAQFKYKLTSAQPAFNDKCEIACVPFQPCPFPKCALCTNKSHKCCKNLACPEDPGSVNNQCINPTCQVFDGKPTGCRYLKQCWYNCATQQCLAKSPISAGCAEPKGCAAHCHDLCGCVKTDGCEYDQFTNKCYEKDPICKISGFNPSVECARADSYYSIKGSICTNKVNFGNCRTNEFVWSVNFGETNDTKEPEKDKVYGIEYYYFDWDYLEDENGMVEVGPTPAKLDKESPVYNTKIVGNNEESKHLTNPCASYLVPVSSFQVGFHELVVRLKDKNNYHFTTRKRFSLRFGTATVFQELDVLSYTKSIDKSIDVYLNFEIREEPNEDWVMVVKGFPVLKLGKYIPLEMCNGRCGDVNFFEMFGAHITRAV